MRNVFFSHLVGISIIPFFFGMDIFLICRITPDRGENQQTLFDSEIKTELRKNNGERSFKIHYFSFYFSI